MLNYNDLHLWRLYLPDFLGDTELLYSLISDYEKGRANQYKNSSDYLRYVVAHGILRILLSKYTQIPLKDINFIRSDKGKLELSEPVVRFNMSHSGDWVLYGITKVCTIGVDVEYKRDFTDSIRRLIDEIFTARERQILFAPHPDLTLEDKFYIGWTRKEAFMKALGLGMYMPLQDAEFYLDLGEGNKLLAYKKDCEYAQNWLVGSCEIASKYVGSYAVLSYVNNVTIMNFLPKDLII